jgi:hypothetical protein
MILIRFTSSCSPYQAGDVAGFADEQAQWFLSKGVAVLAHPEKKEVAPVVKAPEQPPRHKGVLDAIRKK